MLYKTRAEDFSQFEAIVVVVQSSAVETSTAYTARLAGALRDAGLGGERGRAVLSTEGAR